MEAREVVGEAITVARSLDDRECLAQAAAVWGSVTVWNWRPHGMVDDDMVALLEDLIAERDAATDADDPSPPGCSAPSASSSRSAPTTAGCGPPSAPSTWPGGSGTPSCSAGP